MGSNFKKFKNWSFLMMRDMCGGNVLKIGQSIWGTAGFADGCKLTFHSKENELALGETSTLI